MAVVDRTGQRFGRLTVVSMVPKTTRKTYWNCICECGNEKIVRSDHLIDGHVQSCGCYNVDCRKTHGMGKTKLYNIWTHMIHRCYDSNDINYKNYGQRGITVCDEWRSDFMNFYEWSMKNGFDAHLSIERKDVNGNYDPSNCTWATKTEQERNKRNTVYVLHNGRIITLFELSEITRISYKILAKRHFRGDTGSRLTRPVKNYPKSNSL